MQGDKKKPGVGCVRAWCSKAGPTLAAIVTGLLWGGFAMADLAGAETVGPAWGPGQPVALEAIQIDDRFEEISLTIDTLQDEAKKCLPSLPANAKNVAAVKSAFPNKDILALGHRGSASLLVIEGQRAVCVQMSSANHPVFAAEVFEGTVNPMGVDPAERVELHRKLAKRIAIDGVARVAYVAPNGVAFIARYWAEPGSFVLRHHYEFRNKGEWKEDEVDEVFARPSLSAVQQHVESDEGAKKFPLGHRVP